MQKEQNKLICKNFGPEETVQLREEGFCLHYLEHQSKFCGQIYLPIDLIYNLKQLYLIINL